MARLVVLAQCLMILIIVGSCTRNNQREISLELTLPQKISAQSNQVLGLYIVNVHGIPGSTGPFAMEENFFDQYDGIDLDCIVGVDLEQKQIIIGDVPYLPIYKPSVIEAVRTDRFEGWVDALEGIGNIWSLSTVRPVQQGAS